MDHSKLERSLLALSVLAAMGCAHTPPAELVDARTAYKKAAGGIAAQETPAQLHTAESALALAEQNFAETGGDEHTQDLSYVAMRAAQRAEVEASAMKDEKALEQLQASKAHADDKELSALRGQNKLQQEQLTNSEVARKDSDARADRANADLARIATVKEDARGTVITLSGEVLFMSGKAELLPGAQAKLSEVAAALTQQNPEAIIIVEGHTDRQGGKAFNLDLSTRRAQAVCDYLSTHGVAGDRIRPEGLGFSHPVGDNKTAEGRANNRRVEIVVRPVSSPPEG